MYIQYYGTRGSVPVSGKEYIKYGGNTTCVLVKDKADIIIFDAGSGIRPLGHDLLKELKKGENLTVHLFLTHTHWDHIQGFPFFVPAYIPGNTIHIYGAAKTLTSSNFSGQKKQEKYSIKKVLFRQQEFINFPLGLNEMGANLIFHDIKKPVTIGDKTISFIAVPHPNTTLAFKVESKKKKFVFCTDIEFNDAMLAKMQDFCNKVDCLAFDCQYLPEEYEFKKGWGHSTYQMAAKISNAAKVKNLHMIHHDPTHSDHMIDAIEEKAKLLFQNTKAAYDGFTFAL